MSSPQKIVCALPFVQNFASILEGVLGVLCGQRPRYAVTLLSHGASELSWSLKPHCLVFIGFLLVLSANRAAVDPFRAGPLLFILHIR